MKRIFPLMLMLIAVGQTSASADKSDELRQFVEAYEESWQSHDGEQLGRFFADEADMIVGIQPRIVGREAIAEWWDRYFSRLDKGRLLTVTVESIQFLSPNVALINVETTTGGNHSETNETLESRNARGTWVVTRNSVDWKINALRAHSPIGELRVAPGTDK